MIKKDIDYSKLSDKGLLTPPYASWEHALRASIRIWELVLEIPWTAIRQFKCILDYKLYVFDKLNIGLSVLSYCPLCAYADANNLSCTTCPLPGICSDDFSQFGNIRRRIAREDDHGKLLKHIKGFINTMKKELSRFQAKKLQDDSNQNNEGHKEAIKTDADREGALKALEQSLRLWWTIYNLTELEVNQALVHSNTSKSDSLTGSLKLIAWKKLDVDSKDSPQYLFPLCGFYKMSSKCPLSITNRSDHTCHIGCKFTPYNRIHKSKVVGSTGFLYHDKLKLIVADFLSVLWTKYLEMDPFNSKLNNAAEKEKD